MSAFEQLVLPHLGAAYTLARWLVRDPDLAQDVVQEAMLRALRYQAGLRGDGRPWLLRIVRHVALAALADRARAPLPADLDHLHALPDPSPGPADTLEDKDRQHHLHRAVASLPPDLRECLVLREFEELSYKEIAVVVEAPVGTVMSRLWRARRALLDALPP